MTGLALLNIKKMAFTWISRPSQVNEIRDPRPGRFTFPGNRLPQPIDVGAQSLHFTTAGIQAAPIQASFHTVVHPFINVLHHPASLPEFRIGGKYSAVIITIQTGAGIQMTILAIHSIGKSCNDPPGPKIVGSISD